MAQPYGSDGPGTPQPRVDGRTLWAGGAATALVAALVALVGVIVLRGVLDIHILAPESEGVWGDASTLGLMIAAAVGALAATALVHVLLLTTPRATSFFGWIVGLLTVAAAVFPFAIDTSWASRIATSLLYLVVGICILSLVSGVASRAASDRR